MGRPIQLFWNQAKLLPISLPTSLSVFGLLSIILLLAGRLDTLPVLFFAFLSFAFIAILLQKHNLISFLKGSKKEQNICAAILLLFVGAWSMFNVLYTAQNVYVYRDPAIYAVAGAWLKDSNNLEIEASQVFGNDPDIQGDTASFGAIKQDPERLYVHGPHLLPILLGVTARIGGEAAMFHVNALIGGIALLAFYGFSVLLIRPRWALLATSLLAISLPMIYFSRDTYTEPLSLMLTFSSLAIFLLAQKTKRPLLWGLAGLSAGSILLTRIDAFLTIAALISAAFVVCATQKQKQGLTNLIVFLAGLGLGSTIGWLDITELSARYYHDLRHLVVPQLALVVLAFITGLAFVVLSRVAKLRSLFFKARRSWLPLTAVVLVVGGIAGLASRPLWYTSYTSKQQPLVEIIQKRDGVAVEPRNFTEQSINWLVWYVGLLAFVLAILGLVILVHKIIKNKKGYEFIPFIIVFLATFLVYVIRPSITPDHVWASRRFLPIVFPGIFFLACYTLSIFSTKLSGLVSANKARLILMATAFILVFPVAFTSQPFLTARTYTPLLAQIHFACNSLPTDPAVLLVGANAFNLTQSVRTFCDVPAERIKQPDIGELARASKAAEEHNKTAVVFVLAEELSLLPEGSDTTLVSAVDYDMYERRLDRIPRVTVKENKTIHMGLIGSDGSIKPLELTTVPR